VLVANNLGAIYLGYLDVSGWDDRFAGSALVPVWEAIDLVIGVSDRGTGRLGGVSVMVTGRPSDEIWHRVTLAKEERDHSRAGRIATPHEVRRGAVSRLRLEAAGIELQAAPSDRVGDGGEVVLRAHPKTPHARLAAADPRGCFVLGCSRSAAAPRILRPRPA
jgi:hypothetical protein